MLAKRVTLILSTLLLASVAGVVYADNSVSDSSSKIQVAPIDVERLDATTTTTTTATTTTTLPPTTTIAPVPTTLVPAGSKCEELAPIAAAAGWPQELLVDVLDEAWNESRCQNVIPGHPSYNGQDHGPMQINEPTWKDEVTDFYGDWSYIDIPYYNFAWAWEMYKWFDAHGYCGFKPWTRRCHN